MVIALQEKMRDRFYAWASGYVKAPDLRLVPISDILAFVVNKNVFTFEELRAELDRRKIIIHEDLFNLAKMKGE